ncbi:hypothetical protein [Streptomyces griseosporeus]
MVDSSKNIAALARSQPAQLRALEHRYGATAARPLAHALTTAETDATRRWMLTTTPTQPVPAPADLAALIEHIRNSLQAAFHGQGAYAMAEAQRAAYTAAMLGIQHASRITALLRGVPPPLNIPVETGPVADRAAGAIPAAVQEEHTHALALLTAAGLTATGLAGLKGVFSRARRAVTRITAGVATAVTSAAANAALLVARYLGPGVRMLWVAEPGACPACAAYAGRSIRLGGHFPGGLSLDPARTVFLTSIPGPPRHPHCLIGSTRVTGPRAVVASDVPTGNALDPTLSTHGPRGDDRALAASAVTEPVGDFSGGNFRASTTRDYVGDVVTIRTASGKELTGTPNHPVATRFGWRTLAELHVGDDVIASTRPEWELDAVDPDVDHVPPRIEDVAQAFPVSLGPMPCAPEDFHGDGAGSDVYVVRTDGLLGDDFQAAATQVVEESYLRSGYVPVNSSLPKSCALELQLSSFLLATSGFVSSGSKPSTFFRGRLAHADMHGSAPATDLDSSLLQTEPDGSAADAEGFCESLLALAGDVTTDEVVSVDVHAFAGHVYNLETEEGWYIGNGIVTHNCRCTLIPYHPRWTTRGTSLPILLQQLARAGTRPTVPAQRTA